MRNTKEKPNNLTEVVFILDRSGSMCNLVNDTIGGFNAMLEKQRALPGRCLVSTVLFDHESKVLHDRVPLHQVPCMTTRDYAVRGSTALLDAVGDAIRHIATVHRYARREDVPRRTLFIITTDGMENASRRYRADEVRALVERQKRRYGWEFLFMGANLDAVQTADAIGIEPDRAVNYCHDALGTTRVYEAVSRNIAAVRMGAPCDGSWRKDVDDDYATRSHSVRKAQ